jgi:hypothetical protein
MGDTDSSVTMALRTVRLLVRTSINDARKDLRVEWEDLASAGGVKRKRSAEDEESISSGPPEKRAREDENGAGKEEEKKEDGDPKTMADIRNLMSRMLMRAHQGVATITITTTTAASTTTSALGRTIGQRVVRCSGPVAGVSTVAAVASATPFTVANAPGSELAPCEPAEPMEDFLPRSLSPVLPIRPPSARQSLHISLVINIYFLFCRTNSVRDLIFVRLRTWSTMVVWESTTCGSQRDISTRVIHISLVINIYFLFCRTNSVRDLIFI